MTGINLSVPEGTPVGAAEDGVVDYFGNEVKSYSNLVLVRHSTATSPPMPTPVKCW
jgi:murein DD-endopeptidase MepM/ murein hydrolase activator NlpD